MFVNSGNVSDSDLYFPHVYHTNEPLSSPWGFGDDAGSAHSYNNPVQLQAIQTVEKSLSRVQVNAAL